MYRIAIAILCLGSLYGWGKGPSPTLASTSLIPADLEAPPSISDEDRLKTMVETGPPSEPAQRGLDTLDVCTDFEGNFYREGDSGYESCLKGASASRGPRFKRQRF